MYYHEFKQAVTEATEYSNGDPREERYEIRAFGVAVDTELIIKPRYTSSLGLHRVINPMIAVLSSPSANIGERTHEALIAEHTTPFDTRKFPLLTVAMDIESVEPSGLVLLRQSDDSQLEQVDLRYLAGSKDLLLEGRPMYTEPMADVIYTRFES